MRTVETKLYKFEELTEEAQNKAVSNLSDTNVAYDWWSSEYEDAENIGLKITGFDLDRGLHCEGDFIETPLNVANSILKEHGKTCETYRTALAFYYDYYGRTKGKRGELKAEAKQDAIQWFKQDLLSDYATILQQEYEHLRSREAVTETIKINEYEFTADGEIH